MPYRVQLVRDRFPDIVTKIFTLIYRRNSSEIMYMDDVIASISPPQRLSLVYLKAEKRLLLTLFLIFDSRLEDIALKMNEAMIAQIRLAWWRDTLRSKNKPKGEPLIALIDEVQTYFPNDDISNILIAMVDGWEQLIMSDNDMDDAAMLEYAQLRGGKFFKCVASISNSNILVDDYDKLGRIWALSPLFGQETSQGERAKTLALDYIFELELKPLSKKVRALTILAFPAVRYLKNIHNPNKVDDNRLKYGLAYIWHAISGRW